MKKLTALLLFLPFLLHAQHLSTHIPSRATYIVAINPAAHVGNGDASQVGQLEMFTRTNEFGSSGFNFLYGDEDLSPERQTAFKQLFADIFTKPALTGIDTAGSIFIFQDTPDSIHYWCYLLPLNNSAAFSEYVTTKLFDKKPAVDKGSGFSAVNAERMSIGWTNSYAIILLADFDYSPSHDEDLFLTTERRADSIMVAEQMQAQLALATDTVINDSVKAERTAALMKDANATLEKLAKDTTPEEQVFVPDYNDPFADYFSTIGNDDSVHDSIFLIGVFHQLKNLINLNYESSVESVPQFRTVESEKAAALYWYNYGELMQQTYERNMRLRRSYYYYQNAGMSQDTTLIDNMWAGSYVASLISFEGNTATMDQRMYFSPSLQAHTKGLYTGRVKRKMFRYVRGENLMGFTAMSVDMEKFMKFYGSVYREMLSNSFAGIYDNYYLAVWDMCRVFLDEKTLYNLLDGDFLMAVTDLKPFTSSYITYEYDDNFNKQEIRKERTEVRPEFVLVAGVGRMKKAQQILAILERMNAIKKQNNNYYLVNTPGEYDLRIFLALRKGMLIVTNNEDLMLHHLKRGYGRKEGMTHQLRRLGRKSALVAFWDGQKSFELVKKNRSENLSEEDKKSLDILEREVNNGIILGKRSKDGVQRIEMKVELNPAADGKQQTSFVRFFRLLNSLFLVRQNPE